MWWVDGRPGVQGQANVQRALAETPARPTFKALFRGGDEITLHISGVITFVAGFLDLYFGAPAWPPMALLPTATFLFCYAFSFLAVGKWDREWRPGKQKGPIRLLLPA